MNITTARPELDFRHFFPYEPENIRSLMADAAKDRAFAKMLQSDLRERDNEVAVTKCELRETQRALFDARTALAAATVTLKLLAKARRPWWRFWA